MAAEAAEKEGQEAVSDSRIEKSENATTGALQFLRVASQACHQAAEAMADSGLPGMGRMVWRLRAYGKIAEAMSEDIFNRLSHWPNDSIDHQKAKNVDLELLMRAAAILGEQGQANLAAEIVGAIHALETSPS